MAGITKEMITILFLSFLASCASKQKLIPTEGYKKECSCDTLVNKFPQKARSEIKPLLGDGKYFFEYIIYKEGNDCYKVISDPDSVEHYMNRYIKQPSQSH